MHWLHLAIAIVAEVIATSALKAAAGFTRPLPSLVVVAGYGLAFAAGQVGKDTASDQGRGDGDGHQGLADTSRAGKNHGMRDAVFVDEAGELFFQTAVADNRIKQRPVHESSPLRQ